MEGIWTPPPFNSPSGYATVDNDDLGNVEGDNDDKDDDIRDQETMKA